jgi:hypothetical protein
VPLSLTRTFMWVPTIFQLFLAASTVSPVQQPDL